jgi:hypothetical protein
MAIGPGKYDTLCSYVRKQAEARGAIIIVLGGKHGFGFSCQTDVVTLARLPDILESIVAQLREDLMTDLPILPEADDPVTLMPPLRKLRDEAMARGDFEAAVLLSHTHAWLHWARETIRAHDRAAE